jgi:uncharacterized protein (DUF924 family)
MSRRESKKPKQPVQISDEMRHALNEVLESAVAIAGANFGNIQLLDQVTGDLRIVVHRGFPDWWIEYWDGVTIGRGACGTALEKGKRVIVADVETNPIFVGTDALEIQLRAGIRAVQSTPIMSAAGKPLGMFSTHYRKPGQPDAHALKLLDLLARQAATVIEMARVNMELRQQLNAETVWTPILKYWFGKPEATRAYLDQRNELWFGGAKETDAYIRAHFAAEIEAASQGQLKAWEDEPESCLALILLLDQFSMNLERDTRRCYERSAMAIPIAERAIERGFDRKVHLAQRAFFYMPLEHSEELAHQRRAIELFKQMIGDFPGELRECAESYLDYANQHFRVVEEYGRFPGRNEVFGRTSTAKEKKYLDDGGWF